MATRECSGARRGFAGSGLSIAILCGLAVAGPGVARAQDRAAAAGPASRDSEAQVRDRDMRLNRALLETLEGRRLALDARPEAPGATRAAVAFLDRQIKLLRSRIDKDIEFFRRAS
jgi:hypothetical protein